MPKKAKKPDVLEQLFELIKKKIEDASLEELAFIGSWLAGTYIAYNLASPLKALKTPTRTYRAVPLKGLTFDTGRTIQVPAFEQLLSDPSLLALSMVASYKFLKSDIGSISSILSLIR